MSEAGRKSALMRPRGASVFIGARGVWRVRCALRAAR
jgi:hypothetical protein